MKKDGLQFFKSSPRFNRLLILTVIEQNPVISQHTLANEVGLTASMVNNYIRSLAENRLIRVKGTTNRTMRYNLTPKGIREKMSLLISYNLETTALYMDAKKEFARRLQTIYEKGIRSAILFGAGETAEIIYNACQSLKLLIIGIVDNDPARQGKPFGNLVIKPPRCIEEMNPDGVIIASVGRQDEIYRQIAGLTARGIAVFKIGSPVNGVKSS